MQTRVVARYMCAKAVSLLPEFKLALVAWVQGDEQPIMEFIQRVLDIIFPDGGTTPPSWYYALGTAKRTTINWIQKEGQRWLHHLPAYTADLWNPEAPSSRFYKFPDPKLQAQRMQENTVKELEEWGKKLRTLEIASQGGNEDLEIKRGGFTVIPMPGLKKVEIEGALEALDAAVAKIRLKFPQVIYGKVYLSTHLAAKTAAHYVHSDDTIHISVRARKRFDDVYTLTHEFGHRLDRKFVSSDLRKEFRRLSTQKVYETLLFDSKLRSAVADEVVTLAKSRKEGKPFLGMSRELEYWAKTRDLKKAMSLFLAGSLDERGLHAGVMGPKDQEVPTDKVLHGPLAVTPYGATDPAENFAEAFAHLVLGMPLAPELQAVLSAI